MTDLAWNVDKILLFMSIALSLPANMLEYVLARADKSAIRL
jgi:hypothetical protein